VEVQVLPGTIGLFRPVSADLTAHHTPKARRLQALHLEPRMSKRVSSQPRKNWVDFWVTLGSETMTRITGF
jgi:hypothetical protein